MQGRFEIERQARITGVMRHRIVDIENSRQESRQG